MLYLKDKKNNLVPWNGEPIEDVSHPIHIENLWLEDDLNSIGLYKFDHADPVPVGFYTVSTAIKLVNNKAKFINELKAETSQMIADKKSATKRNIINSLDKLVRNKFYPKAEQNLFHKKELEAKKFLVSKELIDAPIISNICTIQFGKLSTPDLAIKVMEKCNKIIKNSDQELNIAIFVEGIRSKYKEFINSAVSSKDIEIILIKFEKELEDYKTSIGYSIN